MNRLLSIAPMMDCTDRHCRYLLRLITQHTLLYTEMVHTGAILHGDRCRVLHFSTEEHPLALQLGGSNPQELADCARIAEDYGYDEINLNVGCPSERVQSGMFGACLMAKPELVASCVDAMRAVVSIPVTVKTRIGIDGRDSFQDLERFVKTVAAAGCTSFIIHARKAVLGGLSPKQNRDIPPLRYELVYELKQAFPQLEIVINGGITDLQMVTRHLQQVDGVMMGRQAYHDPYILAGVDSKYFASTRSVPGRGEIMQSLFPYIERELAGGVQLKYIARHLMGLFQGQPGARVWRRRISELMQDKQADTGMLVVAVQSALPNEDILSAA